MNDLAILQPVIVLIGWTLVMLGWMFATRLPALSKAGIRMSGLVGTKASDADRSLPAQAQWKAHNYNHLLEQPTIFYAVCGVLALADAGRGAAVVLAWGYVILRIAHSLVQATVNRVQPRFVLFVLSSACLLALTAIAAITVF
ncbi:MAPEG family protein [Sphingomonas radiodurans]|uniref:MAPEG family protein n=1 Tax=Sphingomonas radiodurans TaxID=2890321 RepID=UPI001E4AEC73|nr:MAPEG family protein [Sphingomonas radiodurans]WBH16659.1 MAPEG family protein [Sphingomonas radiodurans]